MPPSTFEVRHVHSETHQFYYVLEGEATVELDGDRVRAAQGEGIEIPPGTVHQMRNDGDGYLEFLVMSSQPPRSDRVDLT